MREYFILTIEDFRLASQASSCRAEADLGQDGVDGGDNQALRDAHQHTREDDGTRAAGIPGGEQRCGGPQCKGDSERPLASPPLSRPSTWHLYHSSLHLTQTALC